MKNSINKEIIIFTDGSFIKRGNNIYCGYGVYFPNNEYENISRPFIKGAKTNQRAELYAIYKAIRRVYKNDKSADILIYSDSMYSIKSLTEWIAKWKENGWKSGNKSVMNQDIIKVIDSLISKHNGNIVFKHIRAHTKLTDFESKCNEIVDKLAKNGALRIDIK